MKPDPLSSWPTLNAFLLKAGEKQCSELMLKERQGRNRLRFLLRIHSRLNRRRAARERVEIGHRHKQEGGGRAS